MISRKDIITFEAIVECMQALNRATDLANELSEDDPICVLIRHHLNTVQYEWGIFKLVVESTLRR